MNALDWINLALTALDIILIARLCGPITPSKRVAQAVMPGREAQEERPKKTEKTRQRGRAE